jgi:hypothetical protein
MGELLIPDWANILANSLAAHGGGAKNARARLERDLVSLRQGTTGVFVRITPEETLVTIIEALKVLEVLDEEAYKRYLEAQRLASGQNSPEDVAYNLPHGIAGPMGG